MLQRERSLKRSKPQGFRDAEVRCAGHIHAAPMLLPPILHRLPQLPQRSAGAFLSLSAGRQLRWAPPRPQPSEAAAAKLAYLALSLLARRQAAS